MYQSLRLSLQWLQIDDQLYGSTYPILLYPTTLPKVATELSTHPTLHVALDKVKDDRKYLHIIRSACECVVLILFSYRTWRALFQIVLYSSARNDF